MEVAAQIKNIKFGYKNLEVIYDLSFIVNKGEFLTLIGPSGSGKSTLFRLIAGYENPVSGSILIDGKKQKYPNKKCIVINQQVDIFEWLSVYENLKIINIHDEIIEKNLKLTNLLKYKRLYGSQLSGGMKKRLSIARALSVDSDFIIMDEPFSSLDFFTRSKIQDDFLDIINKSSKSVLLITHDIEEALYLSDRIILLDNRPTKIIKEILPKKDFGISRGDRNSKELPSAVQKIKEIFFSIQK